MRSTLQTKPRTRARSGRIVAWLAAFGIACGTGAVPSSAQPTTPSNPAPSDITVLTSPADARLTLKGPAEVAGTAPLDLPALWTGRYSVTVAAAGHSTAQGVLLIPPRGGLPTALSEPPRLTGGLLIRSLNFPGIPAITSHHTGRGLAFLVAGVAGAGAVARDHFRYRDRLGESDTESRDRAADFHYARNRWAAYTGTVWGLSALDYMFRSRVDLIESTPTRITLGAPRIGRAGVALRSLLVPGAGQEFANRRGRAFLWLGATLASGAAYVIADESRHRINTKLARAESLLVEASPTELAARQADVDHFLNRAQTSLDLTNGLRDATIAIYVANVLDALMLPLSHGAPAGPAKVSLIAPTTPHQAALGLRYRF